MEINGNNKGIKVVGVILYSIRDNYTTKDGIFRQSSTVSDPVPLTKSTGENLDYRLHFSRLSAATARFSTIVHISRLSITILDCRLHLARL